MEEVKKKPKLKRRVSLFALTAYGVGNVLGAGIYALIGEVVGITGNLSWLSFILASVTGALTGLSYAELSAMFPKSAAEFVYTEEAFKIRTLSFILGWIIIFSGIFSAATVALAFSSYLSGFFGIDSVYLIIFFAILLVLILSGINIVGIKTSTRTNILFTLIEASGLIIIIIIGFPFFGSVNYFELPTAASFTAVFSAVALIFFAYIGFEDIANIAEEVKEPHRNLPKAIIYSIIITTILYCLTAISVVSILPYNEIAASEAPLRDVAAEVLGSAGGIIMSLIALFATANTVLIMLIVTSRMMYGMARDKALPEGLSKISPKYRTPVIAVFLTMILTIIPIFFGDISIVAHATVFGVLINFFLVNISLIALRKTKPNLERPFKVKPSIKWVPIIALLGSIVCIGLLFTFDWLIIVIQSVIILCGIGVFYIMKSKIETKSIKN
ncbi:MAG: amino acid transporter [Promethearchaeota archaeon Loki_b32]|nr:MAG: amino acid transporter [Candidatus Lokiarchaeota archaeon Loki_b32]